MNTGDHGNISEDVAAATNTESQDSVCKRVLEPSLKVGPSEVEPEILPDIPIQSRSLQRLSRSQRSQFHRALGLLSTGEGPRALVQANMPVAGLGVYEALLAKSWAIRFHDPEEMVRLAEVAVELAQDFPSKSYGTRRVADLQARAWGELANAFRTADRLRDAPQAFGQAYSLLQGGTGDPYLKARLFDLEASLLGASREFPLALRRLTILSGLYKNLGEPHLAGRTLITQALYTYYNGESEKALQINEQGIVAIDRERDPALFMLALHNNLLILIDLKLYTDARRVLFENSRYLMYRDRINFLKLRWLEGRIYYGLGQILSAEIAFRETRDGLVEAGMTFHSAVASLELAMALRRQDKGGDALPEIRAAREIFLSLRIYREYLGSVIFLEESFQRGDATAELIEATVSHIRRKSLRVGSLQMR